MKALITGAAGRVGRALIGACPQRMDAEALLGPGDTQVPGIAWYRSDITDHDRTVMAVTCAAPDVVIHCAAMTNVDACEHDPDAALRINGEASRTIALASSRAGAHLVYISTDYVFDGVIGPYAETDAPNPVNAYGRSKRVGEQAVLDVAPDAAVVRISVPFGARVEGVGHNFVSWVLDEMREGRAVRVVTDQLTTPAFLDELAEVVWHVAVSSIGGFVHYGTNDRLSRHAMACAAARVFGFDEDLVAPVTTAELGFDAPRPLESGFITDKVAGLLGRPPILFESALQRMLERSEGLP